jgi:hypothetical protein
MTATLLSGKRIACYKQNFPDRFIIKDPQSKKADWGF